MSLSTATLTMMADFGLSLDQIIALSGRIEADNAPVIDEQAEARRVKDRDRKRIIRGNVCGTSAELSEDKGVSLPPNDNTLTPHPSPNSEAYASAPVDPVKVAFDAGKRLLTEAGIPAARQGPMLGKWRRDHGDEALIAALGRCQREGAIDPVGFIEGCFRAHRTAREVPSLKSTAPAM